VIGERALLASLHRPESGLKSRVAVPSRRLQRGATPLSMTKIQVEGFQRVDTLESDPHSCFF
jgi:hypothetical protein